MPDEANPIDQDVIDQFTLGHQLIFKEFGVRPTGMNYETTKNFKSTLMKIIRL
jgi:hypothetical protein